MSVRLQKFLAEAGVASRRAGERLIVNGLVEVNGRVVKELGTKVDPLHDEVKVEGRALKFKRKLYLALNKPRGFLSTRSDELERRIVTDLLPREWAHLHPVGRLDRDSEGLIFLTNDGEFTLRLTHPRYGVRKCYRAIVEGRVEPVMLHRFMQGVEHEGETLQAERARIVDASNSHSIVELELAEGKNREVRRLFESQNLLVERLQRTQIGPIRLGELPEGKWRALTQSEVSSLLKPTAVTRPASAARG
ncbi:MAG: pseudouridine synthase [Limisphaerales bacterium]